LYDVLEYGIIITGGCAARLPVLFCSTHSDIQLSLRSDLKGGSYILECGPREGVRGTGRII
ncbi:hypothetical protein U1Q18_006444, partial [Sarracenia purpurea var. burkii]